MPLGEPQRFSVPPLPLLFTEATPLKGLSSALITFVSSTESMPPKFIVFYFTLKICGVFDLIYVFVLMKNNILLFSRRSLYFFQLYWNIIDIKQSA